MIGLMTLQLALTHSAAGYACLATIVCIGLKLGATILQGILLRGNYRQPPETILYRVVYVLGKTTPALAAAGASLTSALLHQPLAAFAFGLFAVLVAALAWYVVRLRQQGRFFGLLDALSNNHR